MYNSKKILASLVSLGLLYSCSSSENTKKPIHVEGKRTGVRYFLEKDKYEEVLEKERILTKIQKKEDSIKPIYFELDSSELNESGKNKIAFTAEVISKLPADYKVVVKGHTDALGNADYNWTLGLERADAVAEALVANGVDISRLIPLSFGENDLAIETMSKAKANRRVSFEIIEPDVDNRTGYNF